MGLLDDAIREHLDLKRRRGADPTEIERLEREALGPVRRPQAESSDASSADEPGGSTAYVEDESTGDWPEPAPPEPAFTDHGAALADDEEFADWDAPKRAPLQSDEHSPARGAIDAEPDALAPRAPAPPSAPETPGSGSIEEQHFVEQETVEHDVEGEELGRSEEDDMLEETPDFLQDTPDHDRLWFEQRPPRDFDLDG